MTFTAKIDVGDAMTNDQKKWPEEEAPILNILNTLYRVSDYFLDTQ